MVKLQMPRTKPRVTQYNRAVGQGDLFDLAKILDKKFFKKVQSMPEISRFYGIPKSTFPIQTPPCYSPCAKLFAPCSHIPPSAFPIPNSIASALYGLSSAPIPHALSSIWYHDKCVPCVFFDTFSVQYKWPVFSGAPQLRLIVVVRAHKIPRYSCGYNPERIFHIGKVDNIAQRCAVIPLPRV